MSARQARMHSSPMLKDRRFARRAHSIREANTNQARLTSFGMCQRDAALGLRAIGRGVIDTRKTG